MAYEEIQTKKFIDSAGTGYLWTKIKNRYDSKLDEVRAADDSINVKNNNQVSVAISTEAGNLLKLKTTGNKGLYVENPGSPDSYTIVADSSPGNYAAVYHLKKFEAGSDTGVNIGAPINIPRDMVVESGSVVTKSTSGEWGAAGTYIELILANADGTKLWIPVGNLIEYVTSGSHSGDAVFITVDPNTHQVSATLANESITMEKLSSEIADAVGRAAVAVRSVTEGVANGTIDVDGTAVAVHGLGTAAYMSSSNFETAGAAAAVLGTQADSSAANTVFGVKQYASDIYTSITSLTNSEIDAAVAAADEE